MHIKVVWRQIKERTFRGMEAKELAKEFCAGLKLSETAEELEAFEIKHGGVSAYFDVDAKFKRVEMDG